MKFGVGIFEIDFGKRISNEVQITIFYVVLAIVLISAVIYLFYLYNKYFTYRPLWHERRKLRKQILQILEKNSIITNKVGPQSRDKTEANRNAWLAACQESINPNNYKIIELIENNHTLLNNKDIEILAKFKLHADGFRNNYSKTYGRDNYIRYAETGIKNILR